MKPKKLAVEMTVVESPKTGLPTTLEIAARFPHFHRTTTAIFFGKTFFRKEPSSPPAPLASGSSFD